jgi:putative transposase
MKVTRKKIRWIIHQKERQESSGIIAKIQRVTRRRVDQLGKHYRETGIIPGIGEAPGRPKKPVTAEESGVIANASGRFSVWSEDVRDANLERPYRKYFS